MKKTKARQEPSRPLRIAAYIRVSSQRQASEGDSLAAQRHEIEQEVEIRKRREGWHVAELRYYIDAGRSAKDQKRPELQRHRAGTEVVTFLDIGQRCLDRRYHNGIVGELQGCGLSIL